MVSVPDTHQKSLIAEIEARQRIPLLTCSTEDEGVAICAGLYMGGSTAALMIEHAGLYACVNNLRGVANDGKIPLFMMIGLLGREPESHRASLRARWFVSPRISLECSVFPTGCSILLQMSPAWRKCFVRAATVQAPRPFSSDAIPAEPSRLGLSSSSVTSRVRSCSSPQPRSAEIRSAFGCSSLSDR